MNLVQVLSSIVALLGGPAFVGWLVAWWTTRRRMAAETAKLAAETEKLSAEKQKLDGDLRADAVRIVTESAATLLGPLNDQLKQTQAKLTTADDKVRTLTIRVDELVQKVDDANARADAAEARSRYLERQLAQATRNPRSPKETDR